ncbi:hypothetical protein GYMLUDRAFT_706839 [Collybiopsis luxurians FD-317 M1]|uniref:Uncharacterized protein n=1 Tax=Collybiopsis luxurians FD-317 M1 TaxID=944289 RepID=A0A0D0CRB6_9AGAR|nr:hypothetical protein GYMLUDRAFT_706839 [Collybiopsis luxurians FD-317 M1]
MAAPREMLQFMCIAAAVTESGPSQKSFEEVRIDDYLRAYQSTGRPPLPCPQDPLDAQERAARGLPPLFQPVLTSSMPPATEKDLPEWHQFTETKSPAVVGSTTMDRLQSITAAEPYAGFSFEQLRYHAYLSGRIRPPADILVAEPTLSSIPTPTLQTNGILYGGNTNETLLSINSKPEFALHSFEELRLASMKANGRDVTSQEIMNPAISFSSPPSAGGIPGLGAGAGVSPGGVGVGSGMGAGSGLQPGGSSLFGSPSNTSFSGAPPPAPTGTGSPFSFSPAIRF